MSSQSGEEGRHELLEHNRMRATVKAEDSCREEKQTDAAGRYRGSDGAGVGG